MTSFSVRPFQPTDRAALFKIAADTAFFGAPIEAYMEDRNLFLDAFYAYYTDHEPEHAWVACAEDAVVGFLTGAADTRRQERVTSRQVIPRVAWRALTGRYRIGPKARGYIAAAGRAARKREFPSADLQLYPAHLHINLNAAWRGFGLGRRLMEAYLDQLRGLGVPGVHLGTTSLNVAACQLYERMGFRLVGARRSDMYAHLVSEPLEMRCYARALP